MHLHKPLCDWSWISERQHLLRPPYASDWI